MNKKTKKKFIPINVFFKGIRPGIGKVSTSIERKVVETSLKHSYRKTEDITGHKLCAETIRQNVLIKGEQAESIPKIQKEPKEIKRIKEPDDLQDTYKKAKGLSLLKKIRNKIQLYLFADGVHVFKRGKVESEFRESKVGSIVKQKGKKLVELSGFCTWDRVASFRNMFNKILTILLVKIFPIIIISDGAQWIRDMRKHIKALKNAIWILDWFHLKENIEQSFEILKPDESTKEMIKRYLWEGKVKLAVEKIRELILSTNEEEKEKQEEARIKILKYIENQKEGIVNYEKYKQKGYLVGSGYGEKLNDTLVKNRMVRQKRMQWGLKGGEAMMQLLSLEHNGQLDAVFC